MIDPAQAVTMGTVLGAATVYILRERSKSKSEKSNNGHLKVIVEQMATKEQLNKTNGKIGKINATMGIISTNVTNMQTNCKATTERFGKEIGNNRKEILDMAKQKK